MRKRIEDRYRVLSDYLPEGYNIEHDSYLTEQNEMSMEISLIDNEGNLVEYVYCVPETFNDSVHDIINYAWSDYRDKKINKVIDGNN